MKPFAEFLDERLQASGFTTEDTLAGMLPLMRQVVDTHAAGMVAPLGGIDSLYAAGAAIWFQEADQQPPRHNLAAVNKLDLPETGAIRVVS